MSNLRSLLLFQWNTTPLDRLPERYEFTPSKVYYSFGRHHRCYDDWYVSFKSVHELSEKSVEFLRVFNNRANSKMSLNEVLHLLDNVDLKEIEDCVCLWAYVTKDGENACERII